KESTPAAAGTSGRDPAGGPPEASRDQHQPPRAGSAGASDASERDRQRSSAYYCRHGSTASALLQYDAPVLDEPPGSIRSGFGSARFRRSNRAGRASARSCLASDLLTVAYGSPQAARRERGAVLGRPGLRGAPCLHPDRDRRPDDTGRPAGSPRFHLRPRPGASSASPDPETWMAYRIRRWNMARYLGAKAPNITMKKRSTPTKTAARSPRSREDLGGRRACPATENSSSPPVAIAA